MTLRLKLWTRASLSLPLAVMSMAAVAAEGGEGGEAGGAPSQYRLMLDPAVDPVYSADAALHDYAAHVQAAYGESAQAVQEMRGALQALLDNPDAAHLAAAREAWIRARQPYLRTEAFRYYDGPIDGPETPTRAAGPEGRINSWPLNEAVIDGVAGDEDAGLVHALDVPLTRETILARDQVSDEADVTTGWHAIEFLLWGQDHSADGPGDRPASDFVAGDAVRDRRRAYLMLLADQLQADLEWLRAQWDPATADSYATWFLALEPHEAIGRMLTGAANIAGHELASERLSVGLDSGSQEDEQSCFSDSTKQDFVQALAGIHRTWYGSDGKGLAAVLRGVRPALADDLDARFGKAEAAIAALPEPYDSMLASPAGSAERERGEAAVTALQELGAGLRDAGNALGVLVLVSGV